MDWGAIGRALQVLPINRWLQAVGNTLQHFSLGFILVIGIIALLIVNPSGMPAEEQAHFLDLSYGLLALLTLIVGFLATLSGDRLHSPNERSLRKGTNYGTNIAPRSKRDLPQARNEQRRLTSGEDPTP